MCVCVDLTRYWNKVSDQWRSLQADVKELNLWLDQAEAKLKTDKDSSDLKSQEAMLAVSSYHILRMLTFFQMIEQPHHSVLQ